MKKRCVLSVKLLAVAILLPGPVVPQGRADSGQGLGDMVFTTGTVATDVHGREWAYVSWMATDSTLLMGLQYDIYAKAGAMDSANPYAFKGSAMLQNDPKSITVLVRRARHLGQDLAELENTIDQLFAEAIPDAGLSLGEKLAAVIEGSADDPDMFDNLVFMTQAYPALALAMGRGFTCQISASGLTTLEIRDRNSAEVIGRITLEAGNPTVLPAPAGLVQVDDESPMGHLNIRLRWESPDDLKRVSLLQFGYNIYRFPKAFAEVNGLHTGPPSTSALLNFVANRADVVQVNSIPVLIDESTVQSNTYFFIDDNDGLTDGTPFFDGEAFYYYVTALDLLGRDGLVSTGLLARACDRIAPSAPGDVQTRTLYDYDGSSSTQRVEISWRQDTNLVDVANYYVYRHSGFSNMQANAAFDLANRISDPIPPVPGTNRLSFIDDTLTAADYGVTYWYTVRAEDDGVCGPNLSGNSGPAYGLVRDREGPEDTVLSMVHIQIVDLGVEAMQNGTTTLEEPYDVRLVCDRDPQYGPIQWAEFAYIAGDEQGPFESNAVFVGRVYFENESQVSVPVDLPIEDKGSLFRFFCRVGTDFSRSVYAETAVNFGSQPRYVLFKGTAAYTWVVDDDGPHVDDPGNPDDDPWIETAVPPGAEEYRFYRRVDGGRRTLIGQGAVDGALAIILKDYNSGLLNGGEICYYYQFLDEHGNAGPMTLIFCIDVARKTPLPVPVLNAVEAEGTELASPAMAVDWFCPPQGVERFEVAVAMDQLGHPAVFSGGLRDVSGGGLTNWIEAVVDEMTNTYAFCTYRSGRVGGDFSLPDVAEFSISASANLDVEYVLMVRAVGPNGETGPWSNAESFRWSTVPVAGPDVPWPARGLPAVQQAGFHDELRAEYLSTETGVANGPRVGVRIGEFDVNTIGDVTKETIILSVTNNPLDYLYNNAALPGTTALPCVLYRYQKANSLYPDVGGDVAQVSVLMEEIAYGPQAGTGFSIIYDPFVAAINDGNNATFGLYLLDTQPVVRGAEYQYLLLRFDESKELDRIIPAGTVTIP